MRKEKEKDTKATGKASAVLKKVRDWYGEQWEEDWTKEDAPTNGIISRRSVRMADYTGVVGFRRKTQLSGRSSSQRTAQYVCESAFLR